MKLNDITHAVIGASIDVHRKLGPGLLESAYAACVEYELRKRGHTVARQTAVPLVYDEVRLECGYRADLIVENAMILELKAKEALHPVDIAQVLSHLRLLDLRVGLLINFHELHLRDGIKRVVNNYKGDKPSS